MAARKKTAKRKVAAKRKAASKRKPAKRKTTSARKTVPRQRLPRELPNDDAWRELVETAIEHPPAPPPRKRK